MFFQVNQLIIYTSYSKPKTSLHNNIPNLVQERLTDKPHLFPKHCHVKSGVWLSSRPLGKGAINFCELTFLWKSTGLPLLELMHTTNMQNSLKNCSQITSISLIMS